MQLGVENELTSEKRSKASLAKQRQAYLNCTIQVRSATEGTKKRLHIIFESAQATPRLPSSVPFFFHLGYSF